MFQTGYQTSFVPFVKCDICSLLNIESSYKQFRVGGSE